MILKIDSSSEFVAAPY